MLGALFVAAVLAVLAVLAAGVASGQQACAPSSTACNAPTATPLPSIPVAVNSHPEGPSTSADALDVLHRPPARDTASAMPAMALLCGAGVLLMTLGAIAHRRRAAAAESVTTATTPRVLVRAETVRSTVPRDRWDIDAVERAAAGVADH